MAHDVTAAVLMTQKKGEGGHVDVLTNGVRYIVFRFYQFDSGNEFAWLVATYSWLYSMGLQYVVRG